MSPIDPLMKQLIVRAVKEHIVTPAQVELSLQKPGTFIGANGFVGRKCKYCCGPDRPRGNICLPIQEMFSDDVCRVCHEAELMGQCEEK